MIPHARVIPLSVLALVLWGSGGAIAQEYNALAQCRAQSTDINRVHACMDEYLDTMDVSIEAMTDYLSESLTGRALSGLDNSQQAFEEYRRQNCLWYLEFSSPRIEAEQIAKNCLANMSSQRLKELQDLVSDDDDSEQIMLGYYYAYGTQGNSFQPCGREERYWVEGSPDALGLLQQNYLAVATDDNQLLHVTLAGRIDPEAQAPQFHQGVLELSSLIEVRVPTDSDCAVSSKAASIAPRIPIDADTPTPSVDVSDEEIVDEEEQEEPEQQLIAYFGAWVVDCVEITGTKTCSLEVSLSQAGTETQGGDELQASPRLVLNRNSQLSTDAELNFPGREIDSPALIHWQIDASELGDIVGSEIRVDQRGARQLVSESPYLSNDLLPMMFRGQELKVKVLESVDDDGGDSFTGTLLGLSKAMDFADGFVRDDS